jgi:hypothetical protein
MDIKIATPMALRRSRRAVTSTSMQRASDLGPSSSRVATRPVLRAVRPLPPCDPTPVGDRPGIACITSIDRSSSLRRTVRALAVLPLLLLLGSCLGGYATGPGIPGSGGRRVLFVGNSLTYTYDLPAAIADLAKSIDETPLVYKTVAYPDFALEDHWYNGIYASIEPHHWELVVMQQGPSSLPANAEHLRFWSVKLDSISKANGARSALYQVWPASQYMGSFDAVRESYRAAAIAVDGMFIPAGEAWRTAWEYEAGFAFYGGDGFHPSLLATYMNALVHFEMIYGRPATDLPKVARIAGVTLSLSPAQVAILQQAAHETVLEWGIP